ncbi:hypothetical protein Z945_2403 [Sulfitobacter noctilucae]|uniref:hypothetical protein n=1 Tax=Sulfitobacter noctilucae TaxID=1342302 RepID=UPI00046A5B1D|nr:hypothetical protein [Sulfitobacter noctilucae]KIN61411.1 hypothetical protein Z945_2403 [Sulfitobacter noctilucae]
MRLAVSLIPLAMTGGQAAAHAAHGHQHALVEIMQNNDCQMTNAIAGRELPKHKISPDAARMALADMIAEGVVAFADDDKTLMLLPPACKA